VMCVRELVVVRYMRAVERAALQGEINETKRGISSRDEMQVVWVRYACRH